MSHNFRPLGSGITPLSIDQNAKTLIPSSAMGLFSGAELLHYMYGLDMHDLFALVLSCVLFGRELHSDWSKVRGALPLVYVFLYVFQRNCFHYRELACKSLATAEVKPRNKNTYLLY